MPHSSFWSDAGAWIASFAGTGLGLYYLARVLRKDRRDDKKEEKVDQATNQIIDTLREEVDRLTRRVTAMETEIIRLHDERKEYREREAILLAKLAECEGTAAQTKLL